MGCGASVKTASEEQKDEMAVFACKKMMQLCANYVINEEVIKNKSKDVTIPAPQQQLSEFKNFGEALGQAAAKVKANVKDSGSGVADQAKAGAGAAAASIGGAVGGFLNKAADAAGKAVDVATDAMGSAAEKVLGASADTISDALSKFDSEFSKVAQEVVEGNEDAIMKAYQKVINECQFVKPFALCRGDPGAAYENCQSDRVSKAFSDASTKLLEVALLEAVQEKLSTSNVVKLWDKSISAYNDANEKMGENDITKEFQAKEPIKLDIKAYIVQQIILKLGALMGKEEAAVRKNPSLKAENQKTFCRIFSGATITKADYEEAKEEMN